MFNKFIINLVRNFSIIQVVLSLQIVSLVYDSTEPPSEYQVLSLINSGVCIIIFIWLLANCSEEKCKEFLMAQKPHIDCVLVLVLIIRALLASFLLALYVNTNGNFTQKTTFLIASIAGFISVILLIIIIIDSCSSQQDANASTSKQTTATLMKPYFRNHLGNIKNAATAYNYKITPRGARFKK